MERHPPAVEEERAQSSCGTLASGLALSEGGNPGRDRAQKLKVLGRGGYGTVFLARLGDGRRKVLKVAKQHMREESLYMRDAQTLLRGCVHLLATEAIYRFGPSHYVVQMPYYGESEDLFDFVARHVSTARRLTPGDEALGLMVQLLDAVGFLHAHSAYHRDIKLENALVVRESPSCCPCLKLIDWGSYAREGDGDADCAAYQCAGTLHYLGPCVSATRKSALVDRRCSWYPLFAAYDTWACAVVLFCFLVGRFPLACANVALCSSHGVSRESCEAALLEIHDPGWCVSLVEGLYEEAGSRALASCLLAVLRTTFADLLNEDLSCRDTEAGAVFERMRDEVCRSVEAAPERGRLPDVTAQKRDRDSSAQDVSRRVARRTSG